MLGTNLDCASNKAKRVNRNGDISEHNLTKYPKPPVSALWMPKPSSVTHVKTEIVSLTWLIKLQKSSYFSLDS